ncbi:carboxypeptidase regulatory-like domain-containing protein [Acinetobacter variabilis]|uniref:carboxypeptidase regulatory-like domain-containing protein n=1 Tax=Acinetobacter variabilis TaxID=70346 RepID=UPI0021C0C9DF|nr:carboxypeptidase regulatory-like domain-containing protein [Acinetobacter variabilis]UXI52698.1 carboxypeptidase regulatory-like domain-containing protein [Acinetobacter variabilis]
MKIALIPRSLSNSSNPHLHGSYSISGEIKELSKGIMCRVSLYEKATGKKVMTQLTEDGSYTFNGLACLIFYIVAHHPASKFNAVIQDNVVPK